MPDPDFGERVVAAVKAADNPPAADEIIAMLKERLAGYKVPKQVYFVDELPRNVMGKVQKNVLRERYGS